LEELQWQEQAQGQWQGLEEVQKLVVDLEG
jgi:hypothetical protein